MIAIAALVSMHLGVSRDSPDKDLRAAYAKLQRRLGRNRAAHAQEAAQLKLAKVAWEQSLTDRCKAGRPATGPQCFRINAAAVLLTYQPLADMAQWMRFVTFLQVHVGVWGVKHWCATLETCESGRLHTHVMLQFRKKADMSSRMFAFEGVHPNLSANDYLGEGIGGRNPQVSYDRGFFYVFANKKGTKVDEEGNECVVGNYMPAWVSGEGVFKYRVQGRWAENLWKQYKLADHVFEQYIYLTRDNVLARKRNLDACKAWQEVQHEAAEIEAITKRIKSNPVLYQPFPEVPVVTTWLQAFKQDALRFPLLIIQGASATGKTEFAKSLFKNPLELKVGNLVELFPATMQEFKRGFHDALILDDVRDLAFLVLHQEKLQGKYNGRIEFATTQGGTCAYTKYLYQVPIVITINFTTRNLEHLTTNDYLNKPSNRVLLQWPPLATK